MARVRFLPKALNDLEDIWHYTVDRWGAEQAITYTAEIDQACQRLAGTPLIAPERAEFSPPVRIFPQGSHLIVYLIDDQGIVVVRILHKSMDVDQRLSD